MIQGSFNAWFLGGSIVQNILDLEVVMGKPHLWTYVPLCSLVFLLPVIFTFRHIPESISFLNKKSTYENVRRASLDLYGKNPEDVDLDLEKTKSGIIQSRKNSMVAFERRNSQLALPNFIEKPGRKPSLARRMSDFSGIQKYQEFEDPAAKDSVTLKQVWRNKPLLKATIYTIILTLFDEWGGVMQIAMFATNIISTFNFSILLSQIFQLGFTSIRLVGSLLGAWLARKISRKHNFLISAIGCCLCHTLLFILGFLNYDENDANFAEINARKNLAIKITELLTIYLMSIFFNCGVHSIICMVADLVPVEYKVWIQKTTKITSHCNFLISALTFPLLVKKLENYVYLIFIVVNLLFTVWIFLRHVESKDLGSIEIFEKFKDRSYWF